MKNTEKYAGITPAFYACYDEKGEVSPERVRTLTRYFLAAGVQGLYVNGSSGECIYLPRRKESAFWKMFVRRQRASLESLPM